MYKTFNLRKSTKIFHFYSFFCFQSEKDVLLLFHYEHTDRQTDFDPYESEESLVDDP